MSDSRELSLERLGQRARWSREEGEEAVRAWRDSGLSLSVFASRHGLKSERVRRWAAKADRADGPEVTFQEVGVALPVRMKPSVGGTIELRLGEGIGVRLPGGFEGEDLKRVLHVLSEVCSW